MKLKLQLLMIFATLLVCGGFFLRGSKAQQQTAQQTSVSPEVVQLQLARPTDFESLTQYVQTKMDGKFDPSTVETYTTPDGFPVIHFSFTENGTTRDTVITDIGNALDFVQTAKPKEVEAMTQIPGVDGQDNFIQEDTSAKFQVDTSAKVAAAATTSLSCDGLVTYGSPYQCCNGVTNGSGSGFIYGNCTYAAWYSMYTNWGQSNTPKYTWNDAGLWYNNAKKLTNGNPVFPTSTAPKLFSVAVSSPGGHVAWVVAVNGSNISVQEQNCYNKNTHYSTVSVKSASGYINSSSNPNSGFILNPATFTQSIPVYGKSPTTLSMNALADTQVLFSAGNIQGNLKALVTYPNNGGTWTLEPSAQIWIYGYQTVGTKIRLSQRGTYTIQFFNPNGVYSQPYVFNVQ